MATCLYVHWQISLSANGRDQLTGKTAENFKILRSKISETLAGRGVEPRSQGGLGSQGKTAEKAGDSPQ